MIAARSTIPMVGCGGISDAEIGPRKDRGRRCAIQIYTGFIYRGPGLLREIVAGLE